MVGGSGVSTNGTLVGGDVPKNRKSKKEKTAIRKQNRQSEGSSTGKRETASDEFDEEEYP
jgi:hypothetical protein